MTPTVCPQACIHVIESAPAGLVCSLNPAVYRVGVVITPDFPTVSGSPATFTLEPALPAGFSLNAATGVMSGTPTASQATLFHIVTASKGAGISELLLSITVN